MKHICSSDEQKKNVLNHLKCFDETKLPLLYSTVGSWTKLLSFISHKVIADELIPNICCVLHVIEKDGLNIINRECGEITGLETGKFVVDLLKSSVNDAVDLGCGKHKSLQVCNEYMDQQIKLFDDLIITGRNETYKFTPIVPLLKIAKRLDERNID